MSGIMTLIALGLVQMRYTMKNVTHDVQVGIEGVLIVAAYISEFSIYILLGTAVFLDSPKWDLWLIGVTLVVCFVVRFLVTFLLVWFLNRFRRHKIDLPQTFMISYSGLRGAVSFAMVAAMPRSKLQDIFMSTTLSLIFFTVFVQGGTVKYLVNLLRLKYNAPSARFTDDVTALMSDHLVDGLEAILGRGGGSKTIHSIVEGWEACERRCINPYFLRHPEDAQSFSTWQDLVHNHPDLLKDDPILAVIINTAVKDKGEQGEIMSNRSIGTRSDGVLLNN